MKSSAKTLEPKASKQLQKHPRFDVDSPATNNAIGVSATSVGSNKKKDPGTKSVWDSQKEKLYPMSLEGEVVGLEDSDSDLSIDSEDSKQFEFTEWEGRFDFLIASLSYGVGTANFIGFPQRVFANGGGAFLLVYLVIFCLLTIPLLFLETAIGQFSSLGFISVWRVSPLFKGIGFCIFLLSLDLSFAVYQSWVLYYIYHAFYPTLPWGTCDNSWNSDTCYEGEIKKKEEEAQLNSDALLITLYNDNATDAPEPQVQPDFARTNYSRITSAAEEFYILKMLKHKDHVDHEDNRSIDIRLTILAGLVLVYLIVYVVVTFGFTRGLKRIIMYAMLGLPLVLLLGILGVGITLPGAGHGVQEFFTPQWHHLETLALYEAALNNAIYDLGLGVGVLIMLPSLNKFNNNIIRNVLLVSIIDLFVGIIGGITLFCYIGYISEKIKKPVKLVVIGDETRGDVYLEEYIIYKLGALIFIGMPEAFASLDGVLPQLVSVCFFVMLLLTGLRNMIFGYDAIAKSVILEFPDLRRHKKRVVGSIIFMSILASLPFVLEGGFVYMYAFRQYWASIAVHVICFLEVFVVTWVYGFDRWNKDIQLMVGTPLPWVTVILFKWLIPPFLLSLIVVESIAIYSGDGAKNRVKHWSFLSVIPLLPLVVVAIYNINAEEFGRIEQRIRKLLLAPISWGPRKQEDMNRYIDSLTAEELEQREAVIQGMDLKTFQEHNAVNRSLTRMSMVDPDIINIIEDMSDTDIQQSHGIGVEQSERLA